MKIILTQAVVLLVCTIAMDSNLKLKKHLQIRFFQFSVNCFFSFIFVYKTDHI